MIQTLIMPAKPLTFALLHWLEGNLRYQEEIYIQEEDINIEHEPQQMRITGVSLETESTEIPNRLYKWLKVK